MFLEGINDDDRTLRQIEVLLGNVIKGAELRILRYNECENSPYKEAKNLDELIRKYAEVLPKVKYQVSAGSEIKAACGQFLCLTNSEK
jgi:adenine C2-methylase RlmN of 23S rRNA A2503 and tRNA A37